MKGLRKIPVGIKESAINHMNNKSIAGKFVIISVFCVLLPVVILSVFLSYNINSNYLEREKDNVDFIMKSELSDIRNIFDDAVAVCNVVAAERIIADVADKAFANEAEYYEYLMDNNLKDYYGSYVVQKQGIEDVKVYIDNNSILNGGILWRLTEREKESGWYRAIEKSGENIILCADDYLKLAESETQQSFTKDRLSFVRKVYRGNSGAVIGYVKVGLNMSELKESMSKDTDYISFYLVNKDNKFVYVPEDDRFYSDTKNIDRVLTRRGMLTQKLNFGQTSYLRDWTLAAVYDRTRLVQRQAANIALVLLIMGVLAMLMFGIVYAVYRSYRDRVAMLIGAMQNAEEERFCEVERLPGEDEIGQITDAYNSMIRRINTLINDVYKLEMNNRAIEVERMRAEMKYLQSQVNPHFIFNVLNALLVVSVKNGYGEIVPQISGLAKMLRRLLDRSDDCEPLEKEMEFIEIYLKLEKFRFGDKFNYELTMSESAAECSIPGMVVQPLVENACRHGVKPLVGKKLIQVSAELRDKILRVSVKDNGIGIPRARLEEITKGLADEEFKGHIGMKNVYRRLKLYFGGSADMRILSEENKGTEVVITVNYEEGDEV